MKIFLKTEDEINLMRKANQLVGLTLAELGKHIKPGVTTLHLDRIAEEFIRDHGAIPTFKNFPNPNEESSHLVLYVYLILQESDQRVGLPYALD